MLIIAGPVAHRRTVPSTPVSTEIYRIAGSPMSTTFQQGVVLGKKENTKIILAFFFFLERYETPL